MVRKESSMRTIPDNLWKDWCKNPLFYKITAKYPDRDYKYQFELLCDYWLSKRKRLPDTVTAWENWLKHTTPDPQIIKDREMGEKKIETEKRMKDGLTRLADAAIIAARRKP